MGDIDFDSDGRPFATVNDIRRTKELEHQMSLMDYVGLEQFIKKFTGNNK